MGRIMSMDAEPTRRRPGSAIADRWAAMRGWPPAARWASYVTLALVLLLVAVAITGVVVLRRPLPQTSGELDVPGLVGTVQVLRDDQGIPQLYGDSIDDLMLAQGYVHAQERFFQMDVRRHLTAGRLSEMFGETTLETDKVVRTMGWRRVAERELALLEPATRRALESYADGVNAYLASRGTTSLAAEYTMLRVGGLDYTPEDWTPVDSLAWLKAMAWDLSGNLDEEIGRARARVNHTNREVKQLYPPYDYDQAAPIVGSGTAVDGVFDADSTGGTRNPARVPPTVLPRSGPDRSASRTQALQRVQAAMDRVPRLLGEGDGIGSNSWVISGALSQTGAPLLANDPHLGTSLPGVWMQMGLHCRSTGPDCPLDVAGFTFSGVPGVVIGHNADIAWGFTNLGPDVADLFLERVRDTSWRFDGEWLPMTVRTETIKVHGGDDVELRIRRTDHGPLLSDVDGDLATVGANSGAGQRSAQRSAQGSAQASGPDIAVSLSWTALTPSPTADAILKLNLATDWDDFRAAAADFAVPAQNLVYADRAGHIGYQAPGLVPIRQPGNDGTLPSPGWTRETDWTGTYVPFEALPSVLDPDEGFIVTANQAVIGPDYPYFLTGDWDHGYRSERIRQRIESAGQLRVADMINLQLDDRNPMAAVLVPYLLHIGDPESMGSAYYADGPRTLASWDFRDRADSAGAAYFNATWRALLRLTFHDELPESQWPGGGDRWFAAMTGLLADPGATWWDDKDTEDVVETRDDILRQAMLDARDELTAQVALDPDDWEWGVLHRLNLRTATVGESGVGLLEWIVNREGYRVGGGTSIVNATGWDAAAGYDVISGPSMRMVVSLADLDESRWISMTGVSGHPMSDHYVDQTDLWVDGETLPWAFGRAAVEAAAEDTLVLRPAAVLE